MKQKAGKEGPACIQVVSEEEKQNNLTEVVFKHIIQKNFQKNAKCTYCKGPLYT